MSEQKKPLILTVAVSRRIAGDGVNILSRADFVQDERENHQTAVHLAECLARLRAGEIDGVHILRTA